MKLIIETPYGIIELTEENMTIEKAQEELEKIAEDIGYLTIQTKKGPVILPSECAKRSMIRIIK